MFDGMFEIDNNFIENVFRGVVLGRKNYFFVGLYDVVGWVVIFYIFVVNC